MFTRQALRTLPSRQILISHRPRLTLISHLSSTAMSAQESEANTPAAPVEASIRSKLSASLNPSTLEIHNDSHLHAHHAAMKAPAYAAAKETHFRVRIVSDAFQGKMQPARHRMVYALLKEEMQREGGVHALQLTTRTAEEEARSAKKG